MNAARILPALLLLSACASRFSDKGAAEGAEVEETSPLATAFSTAAEDWAVPADVLKAIAYAETQVVPCDGQVEFEGQPPPWGVFGLKGAELTLAAELAGYDIASVKKNPAVNIYAAAALLNHYAEEAGIGPDQRPDPTQWGPAIGRFGGYTRDLRDAHVYGVLGIIDHGCAIALPDGTTLVVGRHGSPEEPEEAKPRAVVVQRPSPNHNSRGAARPWFVVIHTCEGSYAGCVDWLRRSESRVSAHYVVNADGTEISQLVPEDRRAWHIAARYRSALNEGRNPELDGKSSNTYSIGIEHAGRAHQATWDPNLIAASAELVRGITGRHDIPRDRYHIVGHGQLQPESRTDPGPNWPWTSYMATIQDPDTPAIVTVDNRTPNRFEASSAWETSGWASGKYARDYRFREPAFKSDLARWKVSVPQAGRYEVFARIPGNGYASKAPYFVHHREGRTVVVRNQKEFGGQWMSLGVYDFEAVDDWIVSLSCWTHGEGLLVADAVQLIAR